MSAELYSSVADIYPNLERRTLELRGKTEPMLCMVLNPADM
jgi:hypothetical protein